jgi:hypothetical protein
VVHKQTARKETRKQGNFKKETKISQKTRKQGNGERKKKEVEEGRGEGGTPAKI